MNKQDAFFLVGFLALALVIVSCGGCVAYPGARITVNIGWRSAQCEAATNVYNAIEGGGKPSLTLPVTP